MPLITAAQLARVAPRALSVVVAAIIDHADHVLPRYGLATTARLTDFMAHVLVESQGLQRLHENLSYSAERLCAVWPSRFPSLDEAAPLAHNPQALANAVYGGRMGNGGPDDGWLNRGAGLLQTTGHDNIARLARHMGLSFEAARTMLTSAAGMLEAAAATYCMLGAPACADRGDIVGSTRAVNGGATGLADRRKALALCRKVWPRVPLPPAAPKPALQAEAPIIPPERRTTVKTALFLAFLLSLFGITAAQAGTIDLTPIASAGIEYIVVPALAATVPLVATLLVMPLRRYLDQATANTLAGRVDDVLDKAISYGAQQAQVWVGRSDFQVNVDGWIAGMAADYAAGHAPALMKQAGGIIKEKIEARLASHEDVLALKSMASLNDNAPGAPLDLTPAAAKAA